MAITNKPQWLLALAGWVLALGLLLLVWRAFERLGGVAAGEGSKPGAATEDPLVATDPVSNEKITKTEAAARAIYQGRPYWFKSTQNKMAFLTDPERYLGGRSIFAGLSSTASAGAVAAATPTATPVPPVSKIQVSVQATAAPKDVSYAARVTASATVKP